MTGLKPFWCYYGGKWRAAPHYPPPAAGLPIVEPFAGAAGYATRYPDRDVVLVDRDPAVCATWRYLISARPSDILALPLLGPDDDVRRLGLSDGERFLIGWWLNKGASQPRNRPSAWMRAGTSRGWWGERVRARIAGQVDRIKHWRILEGDYTASPDVAAVWFVDPPYVEAGRYYRCGAVDYGALGAWCRTLRGQVIVCEADGARWLPFEPLGTFKANERRGGGRTSSEVMWIGGAP